MSDIDCIKMDIHNFNRNLKDMLEIEAIAVEQYNNIRSVLTNRINKILVVNTVVIAVEALATIRKLINKLTDIVWSVCDTHYRN